MTDDVVDHRAIPGTFEREPEGEFVRTDEPTLQADASLGGPQLELEELREIAKASTASGFPPPPQVAAAIEAADAAEAKRTADAAAEAKREAKEAKAQGKPTVTPPATPPVEPPKE